MRTFFLLAAFSVSRLSVGQTADEVINKYLNATGGLEKWSSVHSLQYAGVYILGPGMEAPVTQINMDRPFKGYYFSFTWQGMTSKTAMQGDSGWRYNPFGGKRESDPLSPEDIRNLNLEYDPQGMLVNYKAKGYRVDYLGTDDMDGSDVYKLRLTTAQGDMVYYYIDMESFYILKIVERIKLKDKEEKTYTVYSDFRKTDYGITVPFAVQTVDENGNEQGGPVNFTKVLVNAPVDAAQFKNPDSQ